MMLRLAAPAQIQHLDWDALSFKGASTRVGPTIAPWGFPTRWN